MARNEIQRAIYAVVRHSEGWAVEHEGEYFDASRDKDEAKAAAHRRARAASEAGRPSQVRVSGEHGFAAL